MTAEYELSPERAQAMLDQRTAQFVDVREQYEWDAGHLAGSRWIPLGRLAREATTLDRERPVVFVCRVGARSGMAAQAFRETGLLAYNLSGGLTAWAAAGLPLEPPDGHVAPH